VSDQTTLNTSNLYQALSRHAQISGEKLGTNHPHALDFFKNKCIELGKIRDHAAKLIASTTLAGGMLLTLPAIGHIPTSQSHKLALITEAEREKLFGDEIRAHVPPDNTPLKAEQEQEITTLISSFWGIHAYPRLENKRLNVNYGLIGAEQHLPRFFGDTIDQHDEYQRYGITPARSAFGYFANSRSELTQEMIQKEKYYVAVQTLYLPNWNQRHVELKDWYKFRKVVVVNPANGKTIIASIADAGPAKWTGKQFGGSPEVMAYLGLNAGMQKGPVVIFFVEDPENTIAFGPMTQNVSVGKTLAKNIQSK